MIRTRRGGTFTSSLQPDDGHVQGDHGTGISKGGFVMAASDDTKADFLLLATYRDEFVREDGRWKFKRRQIRSGIFRSLELRPGRSCHRDPA